MIRYKDNDITRLEKQARAFNSKIAYHKKQGASVLPDPISIKQLKSGIKSRTDFNNAMSTMQRFSKRGAEKSVNIGGNVNITKWQKREIAIKVGVINRRKTKERKFAEQINVVSQGKPVGLTRGEMKSIRMNELRPKKLVWGNFRSVKEFEEFQKGVMKQSAKEYADELQESFKINYIKSLETVFGDDAASIIESIEKMDAKDVVKKLYEDQEATVKFTYDELDYHVKLNAIGNIWLTDLEE